VHPIKSRREPNTLFPMTGNAEVVPRGLESRRYFEALSDGYEDRRHAIYRQQSPEVRQLLSL
jgi:hypothetical protein